MYFSMLFFRLTCPWTTNKNWLLMLHVTSVSFFLRGLLLSCKQDQTTLVGARYHLRCIENHTLTADSLKKDSSVSVWCVLSSHLSHLSQHIWKMRVKDGWAACVLMIHLTEHVFPLNWVGYSKCHHLLSAMYLHGQWRYNACQNKVIYPS